MIITGINNVGKDIQLTLSGEVVPTTYINYAGGFYKLSRYVYIKGNTEALYEVIHVFKIETYEYTVNSTAPLYTFNNTL